MDLNTQTKLFSWKEKRQLTPASTMKLLTSVAAYENLGPLHRFKTELCSDTPRGKKIKNLYIKASGDPYITNSKLWELTTDLRHLGITEISGSIVISDEGFNIDNSDSNRVSAKKYSRNAYNSQLSAFAVNFNNYGVVFSPRLASNGKPRISFDPVGLNPPPKIKNNLKQSNVKSKIKLSRKTDNNTDTFHATGVVGVSGLKKIYRSVSDPLRAAEQVIKPMLSAVGIKLGGRFQTGKLPNKCHPIYTLIGNTVHKNVFAMNKYSNNFVADMLGLLLSDSDIKSQKNGIKNMKSFLHKKVGFKNSFSILDTSGLHPKNKLTTEDLGKLLLFASNRHRYFPEFKSSLAIAGVDGSLKDRFRFSPLKGNLRAKTGTLQSPQAVSSIAGYLYSAKKHSLAFAFISNSKSSDIYRLRQLQETALQKIYRDL